MIAAERESTTRPGQRSCDAVRMGSTLCGHTVSVEAWVPPLAVHETGSGCRLSLGSLAVGHGPTLQQAADQLVGRVLDAALAVCERGVTFTPAFQVDPRLLEFLFEVADLSARGGDVRRRVLG